MNIITKQSMDISMDDQSIKEGEKNMEINEIINAIANEINKGTAMVGDKLELVSPNSIPSIDRIVSDAINRVVVVNFSDGSREVVRCQEGDTFDTYVGVAVALVRYCCGSNTKFRNLVDSLVVYSGNKKAKAVKKATKSAKPAKATATK